MNITDKTTLTFDCYGTLIGWESGIWDGFQCLLQANGSKLNRSRSLEAFAEIESSVQAEQPDMLYPAVLLRTHQLFADRFGIKTTGEMDRRFGDFVPFWPAFACSAPHPDRLIYFED